MTMHAATVLSTSQTPSRFPALVGVPLMLSLVGLCALPVRGQESPLPEGSAILDRAIEATGGAAAYAGIRNRVQQGHHEFTGVGLTGTHMIYAAAPKLRYAELETEALGKVQYGTDGDTVWYLSDMSGPLVEDAEARNIGLRQASFDLLPNWRNHYDDAQCVGIERVGDVDCYKVLMTPRVGKPEALYFSKDAGLLIKIEKTRVSSHMPPVPVEILLDDYRPVDGLLLPHRLIQRTRQCGSTREIVFVTDSIQHNVELPAERFEPPAEVKAAALAQAGTPLLRSVLGKQDPQSTPKPCGTVTTEKEKPQAQKTTRKPCRDR